MLKLGTGISNLHSFYMQTPNKEASVGMPATVLLWSDRYACTVIKVTPCQVHVQRDKAVRCDPNGECESQDYRYEADPKGPIYIFRKGKKGWQAKGMGLCLGVKDEYFDYGF
jgi:hypothetical protein